MQLNLPLFALAASIAPFSAECMRLGANAQTAASANTLDETLPLFGTLLNAVDIEVLPGDSASSDEDESWGPPMVGDGIGQPLYHMPYDQLQPGEFERAEANALLPEMTSDLFERSVADRPRFMQ